MTYRMNTPYQHMTFPTLAAAKRSAHAGLDSIAAKRGYSMDETKRRVGNTVMHYMTVRDSKGRVKTGVVIYKVNGSEFGKHRTDIPFTRMGRELRKEYLARVGMTRSTTGLTQTKAATAVHSKAQEEVHKALIAKATADHAEYPQYAGHFDGYKVGTLRRDIRTKRGVVGKKGDTIIWTDAENDGEVTVTAYLDGCDTRIYRSDITA